MTTDEALAEIVSYRYESNFFNKVSIHSSVRANGQWIVAWLSPVKFKNNASRYAKTPNEACLKALEFIKNNPQFFTKKP